MIASWGPTIVISVVLFSFYLLCIVNVNSIACLCDIPGIYCIIQASVFEFNVILLIVLDYQRY